MTTPAAGHCILIDAADYLDIERYKNAVVALTAWVYAQSGVRGGMHVTGMNRDYAPPTLVRFAIPLCAPDSRIDALTGPLIDALKNTDGIPDMEKTSTMPGIYGQMCALYKPV